MATTRAYAATLKIESTARVTATGDKSGSVEGKHIKNVTYAAAGGTAPTISGYLVGRVNPATPTAYLLAAATAPFGEYSEGFTVAGTKIKEVVLYNEDTTNSITIERTSANGCPIFDAAGDGVTLLPGAQCVITFPAGTAALTTTSNDSITVTPSAGTPSLFILVKYGP